MADPIEPDDAFEDLAAEHALGVLEGEALARARVLQHSDPTFVRAVAEWQLLFAPLLSETEATAPPEDLWQRLSRTIEGAARVDWPKRVRRWRNAAIATMALAASLALALIMDLDQRQAQVPAPASAPRHVAQLVDAEGTPLLAIAYDPGSGTIKVGPAALGNAERVPELWVIPEGGVPHSLGELTTAGTTRIVGRADLQRLVRDGATLAITLEERATIPHTAPTSDIIASGTLTSI